MNKLNYISLLLLTGCSTVHTPLHELSFKQEQMQLKHSNSTASYYQFTHDLDTFPAEPLERSRQIVMRCIAAHKSTMAYGQSTQNTSPSDAQINHRLKLQHYRMATPFAQSDAQLTQLMRSELNFFYQKLEKMDSPYHLFILGHTNSDGTLAFNHKLSAQRAKHALQYLTSLGIEHHQMTSLGMADSLPVASWTKDKHVNNRRLEILLYRPDNTWLTAEHHCYESIF